MANVSWSEANKCHVTVLFSAAAETVVAGTSFSSSNLCCSVVCTVRQPYQGSIRWSKANQAVLQLCARLGVVAGVVVEGGLWNRMGS